MVVLKQNTNIFINSGGKLQIKKCEGSNVATIFMSKAGTPWGGFVIQGKDSQLVAAYNFLWSGSSDAQPIDGDHKRGLGHRNDVPLVSVSFHGSVQIESLN